jgi:hypothetical protein
MAKAKKGGGGAKRSSSSTSFRYALRDSRGRFISAEKKAQENIAIELIKEEFPKARTKKEINKILYSERTYTEVSEDNGLDAVRNFRIITSDSPEVVIITREGKLRKFKNIENAEAVFNEEMSNLWREATNKTEKEAKKTKKKGKGRGSGSRKPPRSFIPKMSRETTETYAGVVKKVVYDFTKTNLESPEVDTSQFKSKKK